MQVVKVESMNLGQSRSALRKNEQNLSYKV